MPIFKSSHPPINVPDDVTIWEYFFESDASPIQHQSTESVAGYEDAVTKERHSYHDVKRLATYLSNTLSRKYGLQPGETVSLFSRNSIWYPVMMFAAVRAGAVVSGASPAYTVDEMTHALKTARARFLATSADSLDVALAAARNAGVPRDRIFLLEGTAEGFRTIQQLIELGQREQPVPAWRLPSGTSNGRSCAFLSFSSGTTGLPKAVMIAHKNVIAQCLQVQQITPDSHRKVVAIMPLFHITGLVHMLHLPILLNAEVIMLPTFTMAAMLSAIQEYQVEEVLLVPPIVIRLVRDPLVDRYDLRCIKRFSSGAAPISAEILQRLQQKFPGAGFKQGYGMTESCSCLTAHAPRHYDFRYAHTVGTIVAGTELRLIRPDGTECGVGEPGEILGRGPQVVMGYLDDDRATRATFDAAGWLHTGDRGVIDADGLVTITDRIKEMIKVNGVGVAPAELEDLLLGHPAVADVAVLGIADPARGEAPKAYVTVPPHVDADERTGQALLTYVRDHTVREKHLREVEFIEAIPKSASGKILRRVLREREKRGTHGRVVRGVERAKL